MFNTEDCKAFIVRHLNDFDDGVEHKESDWKRTRKYKDSNGFTVREFQDKNGKTLEIIEKDNRLKFVVQNTNCTTNKSNRMVFEDATAFCERLRSFVGTTDPDALYNANYPYDAFDDNPQLARDFAQIEMDYENVGDYLSGTGVHKLDCGACVFVYAHGGDWELPVYDVLFWDHKTQMWRGYVPKAGNFYDHANKRAFGNSDYDEDANAVKEQYKDVLAQITPDEIADEQDASSLIEAIMNHLGEDKVVHMMLDDVNNYIKAYFNI